MSVVEVRVVSASRSADLYERRQAGRALAQAVGTTAVDVQLLRLLDDPDPHVGQLAIDVLVQRADLPAARVLAKAIGRGLHGARAALVDDVLDTILWQGDHEPFLLLAQQVLTRDRHPAARAGAAAILDALT